MKHKLLLLSLFGLLIGASIYYKSYLLYDHAYHSSFIRLRISGGPLKIINSGRLYMAIGSAPGNVERRLSLRNSWIKWIEERNDSYYFYTEFPHCQSSDVKCKILQESLIMENEKWKDLVFLNSSSIGRSDYALRGIETLRHAVSTSEARYFLKIDDDGFLCLPKISEELKWFPKHLFLWAKYWFRKGNKIHYTGGRVRPDENFLLMSRDIVEFIAKNYKILTVDYDLTFSANLAFWTHFLNLTIFDDRGRIDSQQHYLTKYMHSTYSDNHRPLYAKFCLHYIYAHHVPTEIMIPTYEETNVSLMKSTASPNISHLRERDYNFNTKNFRANTLPDCHCVSNPSHIKFQRFT